MTLLSPLSSLSSSCSLVSCPIHGFCCGGGPIRLLAVAGAGMHLRPPGHPGEAASGATGGSGAPTSYCLRSPSAAAAGVSPTVAGSRPHLRPPRRPGEAASATTGGGGAPVGGGARPPRACPTQGHAGAGGGTAAGGGATPGCCA
jgi:hypothetical protein